MKNKNNNDFSFWNYSENDTVSGYFGGFYTGKYGLNLVVGDKLVSLQKYVLKDIFKDIYKTLNSKSKIEIKYLGKNNKTNLYSVKINGKEIKRKGLFEKVDTKKAEKFFTLDTEEQTTDLPFWKS